MKPIFDTTIHEVLNTFLADLEDHFESDVVFCYAPMHPGIVKIWRDMIEHLKRDQIDNSKLCIILNTNGGSVEAVEQIVNIIRHHYEEVDFIVPDAAYSAGTIFCMSGNNIHMDYSSSLGPIDPQVEVLSPDGRRRWTPALGYLDKVNEIITKSENGNKLSEADLEMLMSIDIAMLKQFEQAKELTVALLKNWLVQYKWQGWTHHQTNPELIGQEVTVDEKEARAEEIANLLNNNGVWHSHGRSININTLRDVLKLKIEDYSNNGERTSLIRNYNDLMTEYIGKNRFDLFLHSRNNL